MKARITVLFLALLPWMSTNAIAQAPLVLLVQPEHHYGTTYAAPPSEENSFVFFVGEPIYLQMNVANWGNGPHELTPSAAPGESVFRVRISRDRAPSSVRLVMAPDVHRIEKELEMLVSTSPVHLPPGAWLRWRASIQDTGQLRPGAYTVDVTTTLADEQGNSVRPHAARLAFELRPSASAPEEVALRAAWRYFREKQYDAARSAVATLLSLNSNSHAANVVLGDIAVAEQKPGDA